MEAVVTMFALSLGLTLGFELPVALLWGLRGRDLGTVAAANLMTNPLAVALAFAGLPQLPIELGVVLAEWGAYRLHRLPRPLALALVSNVLSYGLGLLIQ